MIRPLLISAFLAALFVFSGCRSRDQLELYRPGEVEVWRTTERIQTPMTEPDPTRPRVVLETTHGEIHIELFDEEAPVSTENFLRYVDDGFYDGTLFHRVIPGFMIQGGGFEAGMRQKNTRDPIHNEAGNGLRNQRGTLAMARTQHLHSATSQFFINVADNAFLNGDGVSGGYAVFARVVDGMDVVDRITFVETDSAGPHDDVPVTDVVIRSARRAD